MEKLVSVIVPIYNNEKDLKRCVDSIVNQTYENLEIILIDDGSTDNSVNICNEYMKSDDRIKVIHKKNGGVSQSRNLGLKESRGKKIIFVDSDDYIANNYVERLMIYEKLDLVICGYFTVNGNETKQYIIKNNKYMNKKDILKNLTKKNEINFYSVPYLKLFDKNIIDKNNIIFNEEIEYGEDACFVYEYISKIENLQFINEALYFNNISREESLSRKKRDNVWKEMYEVFKIGQSIYPKSNNKYSKQITQLYMKSAKTALNNAISNNATKSEFNELCKQITQIKEFDNVKIRCMPIYDMVVLLLLRLKKYSILKTIMKLR